MEVAFVEYIIVDIEKKGIKILMPKRASIGQMNDLEIIIEDEKIKHISKTNYQNNETCYVDVISVDEFKKSLNGETYSEKELIKEIVNQANNEVIYIENDNINKEKKEKFEEERKMEIDYSNKKITEFVYKDYTIKELVEILEKKILFQTYAIKRITSTIINNEYLENPKNIVLLGSRGVGKSKIIDLLARELSSPYAKVENYDGDTLSQAYLTLFLKSTKMNDYNGPSIIFIDGINKGIEKIAKIDGDILVEIISKIFKKKSPFPIQVTEKQTVLFDPSNINYIVALDLEKDIDMPYMMGIGTDAEKEKQKIINNLREMLVDANCEIIDMNNLTEENLVEILKKSEISPINEYRNILYAQGTRLNVSKKAYELLAHSAYKLNKGAKGLSIITDYVIRDEIIEAQYNGTEVVNINQNKVLKKLNSNKKIY